MQWFHRSTKCGRGRGRRTNSARISHPPPFRRVTKNETKAFNYTENILNSVFAIFIYRIWNLMYEEFIAMADRVDIG